MRRCSYCGREGAAKEKIGQQVIYVCDDSQCLREFSDEESDYERGCDEQARDDAAADNYDRYRW